jgi:LysM repeat protein
MSVLAVASASPCSEVRSGTGVVSAEVTQRASSRPLQLTGRGRRLVLALVVLVSLVVAVFFASSSAATENPGSAQPTHVIVVQPGQTLWQIAAPLAGDGEVPEMIDQIMSLNNLSDEGVSVGQRLRVPKK